MAPSSFTFELTILQAKNTDSLPDGSNLFVRFYLPTAGGQRIHLDTVDVPAAACSWDEAYSLQCSGSEDTIKELKQESVVFELRQRRRRRRMALFGGSSSKLLGTAELPWRKAFEAPDMKIEKWVPVIPSASISEEGEKPPSIRVAMNIRSGSEKAEGRRAQRRQSRKKRVEEGECCCGGRCDGQWGCGCGEEYYHVFAMAAALEAF